MDLDAAREAAGLNPLPNAKPTEPEKTVGNIIESTTIGNELTLRGIPVVGSVSGAILGTRPGIDSAAELDRASRDLNDHARAIVKARMKEARKRLKQPDQG